MKWWPVVLSVAAGALIAAASLQVMAWIGAPSWMVIVLMVLACVVAGALIGVFT